MWDGSRSTQNRLSYQLIRQRVNGSNNQQISVYAGAKEDDYLVEEELKAVIVKETKKGEKEWEEALVLLNGLNEQIIKGLMIMQVPKRMTTVPSG
jgi:hypothetical protein